MRRASFLALPLASLTACASGPTLTVVVRTDFAPTTEFTSVQVMLESAPQVHAVRAGDDWFHGVQVAAFGGVTLGSHDVRAALLDASGATVAARHVILTLSGDYTLTVELTRSCAALHCPGSADPPSATECLGSRCVDPHCGGTDTAACPPAECTTAATCPAPVAACATASCDHGLCLYAASDMLCPPDAPICDLARGCVSMVEPLDGGPPDLGSADLGPADLGPPDLGPADLGSDMGQFCIRPADCLGGGGDGCTIDDCVANRCTPSAAPDGTHCDAGPLCAILIAPSCHSGMCTVSGTPISCDDHDPCTDDRCSMFSGACHHGAVSGTPCAYGDAGCLGICNVGICGAPPGGC